MSEYRGGDQLPLLPHPPHQRGPPPPPQHQQQQQQQQLLQQPQNLRGQQVTPLVPLCPVLQPLQQAAASPVSAPPSSPLPTGRSDENPPPFSPGPASAATPSPLQQRPLNVKDALSYLDQVKVKFQDQPDVYNKFLDIMKEFKSQSIDTPGVIQQVSTLFRGHPELVSGFNTFLPPGYHIEYANNPHDPNAFRVTTPAGITGIGSPRVPRQKDDFHGVLGGPPHPPPPPTASFHPPPSSAGMPAAESHGVYSYGGSPFAPPAPPPFAGRLTTEPGHAHIHSQQHQQQQALPVTAHPRSGTGTGGPAVIHPNSHHGYQTIMAPPLPGLMQAPTPIGGTTHGPPSSADSRPIRFDGPPVAVCPGDRVPVALGGHPQKGFLAAGAGRGPPLPGGFSPASQASHVGPAPLPPGIPAEVDEPRSRGQAVEFNHAIDYVNKIKNRFASEPEIYKQFLEILQMYQREVLPIQDVYAQVTALFRGAPDLLDEFKQFLPDHSNQGGTSGGMLDDLANGLVSGTSRMPFFGKFPTTGGPPFTAGDADLRHPSVVASDRVTSSSKKKGNARVSEKGQGPSKTKKSKHKTESSVPHGSLAPGGGSPVASSSATLTAPPQASSLPTASASANGVSPQVIFSAQGFGSFQEEISWFEKVKKHIGNKSSYNEFLKILNLFSQGILDHRLLVEHVECFIGNNPSLFQWLKECMGYDRVVDIVDGQLAPDPPYYHHRPHGVEPRPRLNIQHLISSCPKVGKSYRMLPVEDQYQKCSGRDALDESVLNDVYVSHPTWASEDQVFSAHKKNQYEEALHKCEEDRYEYDMNIGAIQHVITALEAIARKLNAMTPGEKALYSLPPGLGGPSEAIYQRVIQKVYDKERGKEVLEALRKSPATAVPVVLRRLKKKDEEWRRGKREWNKVWREIDAKNFYKALDHQGVNFKANDKRSINTKALVSEIAERHRTRIVRLLSSEPLDKQHTVAPDPSAAVSRGVPDDLSSKNDLEFKLADTAVFRHVTRLLNSYMDRSMKNLPTSVLDMVVLLYRDFMREFFMIDMIDPEDLRLPNKSRDVEPAGLRIVDKAENGIMDTDSNDSSNKASGAGRDSENEIGIDAGRGGMPMGDLQKELGPHSTCLVDLNRAANYPDEIGIVKVEPMDDEVPIPVKQEHTFEGNAEDESRREDQHDVVQQQREHSPTSGFSPNHRLVKTSPFVELEEQENGGRVPWWKAETWITWGHSSPSPAPSSRAGLEFEEDISEHTGGSLLGSAVEELQSSAASLPVEFREKSVLNGNANLYCFFRLYELLYSRVEHIRRICEKCPDGIPARGVHNETADQLGRVEPLDKDLDLATGEHCYDYMLHLAEKLFAGEVDQAGFENRLRDIFGTEAYPLFTLDKVVQAVLRQAQAVVQSDQSVRLLALCERYRKLEGKMPKTIMQFAYRTSAGEIIGPDNAYKIEFLRDPRMLVMHQWGDEDLRENSMSIKEKMDYYGGSYVLMSPTAGVTSKGLRKMYLERNKKRHPADAHKLVWSQHEDLRVRADPHTYKLRFKGGGEHFFRSRREGALWTEARARRAHKFFVAWLESDATGWARRGESSAGQSDVERSVLLRDTDHWLLNGPEPGCQAATATAMAVEHDGVQFRRFRTTRKRKRQNDDEEEVAGDPTGWPEGAKRKRGSDDAS